MLAPDQRELFLDALRPPEGYQFDRGIGTTFTLDLLTLLIAPLSLALLEVSDSLAALSDPVLLLEGLRRYADRLAIFCQAGRIAIPPPDNYLYSFFERGVVEVQAPRGGVFHPKVWLLRYVAEAEEAPPLYRLLNLSRNLTFDKSWDLMLRLEGHVATHRKRAYSCNHPLGDFVRQLPELALHPADPRIAEDIALLQDEVRRVAFQAPWPFKKDDVTFFPSGFPGYRGFRFDQTYWRLMVVSPFLSDRFLQQVTEKGEGHILVSRADSIAALNPVTRARFEKRYVLDEAGTAEVEADPTEEVGEELAGVSPEPSGLHAKLFVLEAGWDATWLVGSANATNAAFQRKNVEFMVRLQGRRSRVGIDRVMGEEEDEHAMVSLLRAYRPIGDGPPDGPPKQVEELADSVRDWLVRLEMRVQAVQQDADQFDLLLHRSQTGPDAPEGEYAITCWPVTLRREHKITFEPAALSGPLTFSNLSPLALTPFTAFEVVAQIEDHKHTLRFVLNLPISGIPESRKDHLFSEIIRDQAQFLRYLWLMLRDEAGGLPPGTGEGPGQIWRPISGDGAMPLLEALVRALSRSPEKLEHIAELVEGLQRTPEGRDLLPEGFEPLWEAVTKARSEMQ